MRFARACLNATLSAGAKLLARAPDEAVSNAAIAAEYIFRNRVPLPDTNYSPRVWRDAVDIACRSVIATPYGAELQLQEPLIVTISVGQQCPLRCTNCYSNSTVDAAPPEQDRFLTTCRQLASSRTPFFVITGGEPLLHPDIVEGINILTANGKMVTVATNVLLRAEMLKSIAAPANVQIMLALWGDKDAHDALRGSGSFDRVRRNAILANSLGFPVAMHITLSEAPGEIWDAAVSLLRAAKFNNVRIMRKINVGRYAASQELTNYISSDAFAAGIAKLKPHCRKLVIDVPEKSRSFNSSFWRRTFGLVPISGCGAGAWMWHVDSNGRGQPCAVADGLPEMKSAAALTYLDAWRNFSRIATSEAGTCRLEKTKTLQ